MKRLVATLRVPMVAPSRCETEQDVRTLEQLLKTDHVQRLLNDLVDQKLKEKQKQGTKVQPGKRNRNSAAAISTPVQGNITDQSRNQVVEGLVTTPVRVGGVKSPSDTTIYALAINRAMTGNDRNCNVDEIAAFVESMRVSGGRAAHDEGGEHSGTIDPTDVDPDNDAAETVTSTRQAMEEYEEAKCHAEQAILDAEKYKAMIMDPPTTGEPLPSIVPVNLRTRK